MEEMYFHLNSAAAGILLSTITELPNFMTPDLCILLTKETMIK